MMLLTEKSVPNWVVRDREILKSWVAAPVPIPDSFSGAQPTMLISTGRVVGSNWPFDWKVRVSGPEVVTPSMAVCTSHSLGSPS